jgi:hypothetical protein
MAELQSPAITGSLTLGNSANTTFAGAIWYDTSTNQIKYSYTTGTGTWSTGGALITARYALAGAGTQNAGLAFGGQYGGLICSCTEEYNGTSWSTGGALITGRNSLAGAGTQTAGLAFGGNNNPTFAGGLTCTEEYTKSICICTL